MKRTASGFVDNYSNYGPRSDLQIKSVLSLISHNYNFDLISNTFEFNSGTKGVVMIESLHRNKTRILIAGNNFTQNAGYLDSNTIFIRARGP